MTFTVHDFFDEECGRFWPPSIKAVKVRFVVCKGVFVAYIFYVQISARSYDTFGMTLIFALNETIPQ